MFKKIAIGSNIDDGTDLSLALIYNDQSEAYACLIAKNENIKKLMREQAEELAKGSKIIRRALNKIIELHPDINQEALEDEAALIDSNIRKALLASNLDVLKTSLSSQILLLRDQIKLLSLELNNTKIEYNKLLINKSIDKRKTLEALVLGSYPNYSEFDNTLVKKAGHSYNVQNGITTWNNLSKLTSEELYELHLICINSWN